MTKLIFIIIFTLSLFSCKRECKDENADNYKDDYNTPCDYSHADNWDKEILVDSILINNITLNFLNISKEYHGAYYDTEKGTMLTKDKTSVSNGGINECFLEFNKNDFIKDSLRSIEFYFSIPVGSNYSPIKIDSLAGIYINNASASNPNESYVIPDFYETLIFTGNEKINGLSYNNFKVDVKNLKSVFIDTIPTVDNFKRVELNLRIEYDVFRISYKIHVIGCTNAGDC